MFYDSYGRVKQDNEFDFGINTGAAPSGTPLISKLSSYANIGSGINDRPACVQVSAGSSPITCGTAVGNTRSLVAYSGYDAHGSVGTISRWVGGTAWLSRSYTYYTTGLVNVATDVNGAQTSYANSNCNGLVPSGVNLPLNLSRSMTWDCKGGILTSITGENGEQKTVGFQSQTGTADPFWRVLSETDPLGNVTWKIYTPATNTTGASVETYLNFPVSNPSSTVDTLVTLDSLGRVSKSQQRTAPSATTFDNTIQYGYGWSSTGQFLTKTVPGGSAITTTQLDALGRTQSVVDGANGTLTSAYTKNDVLSSLGPAPNGENLKKKQVEYDALGRITSVCEISSVLPGTGACIQASSSPTGYFTKYTYDVPANSMTVTQNAQGTVQTRTYQYDGLGRLVSETNPESGTTRYTFDSDSGGTCAGTYNGDLVKRVDNAGNVSCYTYDGLHRKLSTTYSGPNATTNRYFVYDAATVNGQSMTNAKGRLAEAYTATCASCSKVTDEGFSYTARGEVTNFYESTPHSAGYYSVPITYWANGLIQTFGPFLTEDQAGYIPDGEGRAAAVHDYHNSNNTVPSVTYNAASQPTQITTSCNGATCYPITYQYDPNTLRMTQYGVTLNGGTISGTLTWNPNGSLKQLVIVDPFNSADAQSCNYSADDLSRIAGVSCGSMWAQTFGYDAFGNITKSGSTSWMPGYNSSNNHYQLGGTSYDPDGNLLNDTFNTYTWDAEGKPLSAGTSSFVYDAFGRKVEWLVSGAYEYSYVTIGNFKLSANGQAPSYSEFPFPGGSVLGQLGGGTGVKMADWLGTMRVSYSYTGGSFSQSGAHAPFGESYSYNGGYPMDFTGQQNDGNMVNTTYYFPERQLRSSQGRWLSPDPAGLAAVNFANPQSWNRYAYVANNPLAAVDPNGLKYNPAYFAPRRHGFGNAPGCGDGDPSIDVIAYGGCDNQYFVNGAEVPPWVALGLLGNGVGVQCPPSYWHRQNPATSPHVYRYTGE